MSSESRPRKEVGLELSREHVLDFVRERAGADGVARAEAELPDRVDTTRHAELLSGLGLDPSEIVSQFNGRWSAP